MFQASDSVWSTSRPWSPSASTSSAGAPWLPASPPVAPASAPSCTPPSCLTCWIPSVGATPSSSRLVNKSAIHVVRLVCPPFRYFRSQKSVRAYLHDRNVSDFWCMYIFHHYPAIWSLKKYLQNRKHKPLRSGPLFWSIASKIRKVQLDIYYSILFIMVTN